MDNRQAKKKKLDELRKEILCLQGLEAKPGHGQGKVPLGPVLDHLPGNIFPAGAIHEFISATRSASAAANGFISAVVGFLMQKGKPCLWISPHRTIFPPALKAFNLDPDRIIFIDTAGEKETLWVMEEALKCPAVCAVVGEVKELDFPRSRRLQLAVEDSRVTGFVHRLGPRCAGPTASVARWKVLPAASRTVDGLPGMGLPCWEVELLKVRNGKPGCWELEWAGHAFHATDKGMQKHIAAACKTGAA